MTSFLFVQDTYAKKAVSTYENRKLKLQSRLNFKTMSGSQAEKLKDKVFGRTFSPAPILLYPKVVLWN